MKTTTFFVPGIPVPKGSARAFVNRYTGRASVVQTNADKQKPWASLITLSAQEVGLHPVVGVGITLGLTFRMPRPKSHFKPDGSVRPRFATVEHVKKPDIDKLIRCVVDALTGVAYVDDSQVVIISAVKRYACPADAGCFIQIGQ